MKKFWILQVASALLLVAWGWSLFVPVSMLELYAEHGPGLFGEWIIAGPALILGAWALLMCIIGYVQLLCWIGDGVAGTRWWLLGPLCVALVVPIGACLVHLLIIPAVVLCVVSWTQK